MPELNVERSRRVSPEASSNDTKRDIELATELVKKPKTTTRLPTTLYTPKSSMPSTSSTTLDVYSPIAIVNSERTYSITEFFMMRLLSSFASSAIAPQK